MKANWLVIANEKEIEKGENLGLPVNPIYEKRDLLFDLNEVNWAVTSVDNNIDICINGMEFRVEFNHELWEKLKLRFNA